MVLYILKQCFQFPNALCDVKMCMVYDVITIECTILHVSGRLLFTVLNIAKRSCKRCYYHLLSLLCRQFPMHTLIAFPFIRLAFHRFSSSFQCEIIIFLQNKDSFITPCHMNTVGGTVQNTEMGGLPSANSQASLVCSHDK